MTKKLLIDSTHAEEVRLAIVNEGKLEEFESETCTKKQVKGNIYLAKVIRVEPSLQAAFVEYGAGKNGFLPFSEIHPDYYYIPVSDRQEEDQDEALPLAEQEISEEAIEGKEETGRNRGYRYKIQEVIKRKQIMLIQVVKEERGGKGAALTTFLSLAGRYCVLMPNAGRRTGGVSRKISDGDDRKRLKDLVGDLKLQEGMSVIIRTAGQLRSKTEVRRDYEYILKIWADIREKALNSIAPALVYEEGSLIQRALRDIYQRDMDEILIEG
ncbi:MAG TPA: ribonuclease E/G, partial [Alphaproteobacteria bacterium]|nr:ribonuclease E/G [Alphaproteobacteria bacterium]